MSMCLSVFIFIHFVLNAPRISTSTATSCSEDYDCFPSGGKKCCLEKCSARKYCENFCSYNGDCDISKQENCISNKCTTEARTLEPGHCRYSYECDKSTEICDQGECKKIKGLNGGTDTPKSGNSSALVVPLLAVIIPAVIVIVLVIGVCFANYKIRAIRARNRMSDQVNEQTHQEQQTELQSVTNSQTPYPLPSAPPLLPYVMSSGGDPPSQAPPSYEDAMKNTYSYVTTT